MAKPVDLKAYLGTVDPSVRGSLDRLRGAVEAAHAGLTETIKWNAPSYAHAGKDRVTLGLDRKGGLRLVLHRGAAVKTGDGFTFIDESGLATWPSADRGVVILQDEADVAAKADRISHLVRRWIAATA